MARPTKLNKATITKIVNAIRAGLTYERAAQAAGVSYDSLNRWREQGKADAKAGIESEFCEFCDAVTRAEAEGEAVNALIIQAAAKGGQKVKETKIVKRHTEIEGVEGAAFIVEETTTIYKRPPDWRAALTILERRHPEQWAKRDTVQVEIDWRKEAEAAGVDANRILSQLETEYYEEAIAAGVGGEFAEAFAGSERATSEGGMAPSEDQGGAEERA